MQTHVTSVISNGLNASRVELCQNELPQSEVAELDQSELPPNERPHFGGFFKLSHAIFRHSVIREMSGDCFRLFLWMSTRAWRFPDSNGVIRASVSFIEGETGMGHATISRGLAALKRHGLVTTVRVDYKLGNLWRVANLARVQDGPGARSRSSSACDEETQIELASSDRDATSVRESGALKISAGEPRFEQQFKKQRNLKKISQEAQLAHFQHSQVVMPSGERMKNTCDQVDEGVLLRHFENELSEETRNRFVRVFTEMHFSHGFLPPPAVVRSLAARAWFRDTLTGSGRSRSSEAGLHNSPSCNESVGRYDRIQISTNATDEGESDGLRRVNCERKDPKQKTGQKPAEQAPHDVSISASCR